MLYFHAFICCDMTIYPANPAYLHSFAPLATLCIPLQCDIPMQIHADPTLPCRSMPGITKKDLQQYQRLREKATYTPAKGLTSLASMIQWTHTSEPEKEISMTDTNKVPNTLVNKIKVRQAVAQFMVERVLDKQAIQEMAMDYLEQTFEDAGHTIADLAQMVKETEIPPAYHMAPPQPDHMLCYGTLTGYQGEGPNFYFYTKEQDYEYSASEVKGAL